MHARIYRPAKTAMQSGRAKSDSWVLEFAPERPLWREPLMGWTASAETQRQISLRFASLEEATAYAEGRGLTYEIAPPTPRRRRPQNYADNFRIGRPVPWTH